MEQVIWRGQVREGGQEQEEKGSRAWRQIGYVAVIKEMMRVKVLHYQLNNERGPRDISQVYPSCTDTHYVPLRLIVGHHLFFLSTEFVLLPLQ